MLIGCNEGPYVVTDVTPLLGDVDNGEAVCGRGAGFERALNFPFGLAVKLKLL